jgi:hypothetical protein
MMSPLWTWVPPTCVVGRDAALECCDDVVSGESHFVGLVWFGLVWFGLVWFGLVIISNI